MNPYRQKEKDFIKLLRSGEYGRTDWRKFEDFLEMAFCAIAKTTALTQERADKLEDRYMNIVNSYKDKDFIREQMPKMLALATVCASGYQDFLGGIAGELEALNKHMGQFFTPMSVSRMMAQMILADSVPLIEKQGFIVVGEPASGAGGMMLAAAEVIEEIVGKNPATAMWCYTADLSPMAYKMSYIQMSLAGISALVCHENSLSLERFDASLTPNAMTVFYPEHRVIPHHPDGNPADILRQAQDTPAQQSAPVQLKLF